jgi:hypothetical protein
VVTENVTIVIRERGAKATARSIGGVGKASRLATVAVTGLLGALAGFLAIRGITRLTTQSVKAAASFEQFGIRIAGLLGNQQDANDALQNFVELAARTPFAVSEVVAGASALGAAALKNKEGLQDLTFQAANLAATTGLSFVEAASNLQRSLTVGIAAADLFREKGVRALIESIAGIPDATKLSTDEVKVIFRETFGEGGVFGGQAEALANTLGGAISNIGDAAQEAQKALGFALSPVVVNTLRKVLIPFLKDLENTFKDNATEIREFAADVVKFGIPALTLLARVMLSVIATFIELRQFTRAAAGAFQEFQLDQTRSALEDFEEQVKAGNRAFDDPLLLQLRKSYARLRVEVDDSALAFEGQREEAEKALASLDAVAGKLGELDALVSGSDFTSDTGPAPLSIDLPDAVDVEDDSKTITAQANALKRVLAITNQIRISSAARSSQLEGQLERLSQQADKLREAAIAAGDETLSREGLLLIEGQILTLRTESAAKLAEEAAEEAKIAAQKRKEAATELGGKFLEGLRTGGSSVIEELGDLGEDQFKESFGNAIEGMGEILKDTFESVFEDIDFGSLFGEGSGFGDALGAGFTAAAGLGASLLSRELAGGSSNIRNDLVQGATQSAQATRGVIAGPTSIPIFQVGQQLEAALITTEGLLGEILASIQAQPLTGGGAGEGGDTGVSGPSADLSLTAPSLV